LKLFVDTTIWSLALRRDHPPLLPAVDFLAENLRNQGPLYTTGLVLQEVLQGFSGPKDRALILKKFEALPFFDPEREDYVAAADIGNVCRRHGVQIKTVDALLAQLCIRHDLTMLTTDNDFIHLARHAPLKLWRASTPNTPP